MGLYMLMSNIMYYGIFDSNENFCNKYFFRVIMVFLCKSYMVNFFVIWIGLCKFDKISIKLIIVCIK